MIGDLVKTLEEDFEAAVLTSRPFLSMPKDIDIYIPEWKRGEVLSLLKEEGFACTEDGYKIQARKFIGGEPYFLDIAFNANYLNSLYPGLILSKAFTEAARQDPDLERFFKYVFSLYTEEKTLAFIGSHYDLYRSALFNKKYVSRAVFRPDISKAMLLRVVQKKPNALVVALASFPFAIHVLMRYFFLRVKHRISRLGKGRIIAVVGPDGSGKTMVVERLSIALPSRKIYMGDWGFILQPLYNKMHEQHIAIARLTYVFFYIENWLRYVYAFCLKLGGATILTDRYPGLNRHLRISNIWLRLNDLLYVLFPRADLYLFVSADPAEIHRRKSELTAEEIAESQKNMRQRLPKGRSREILNVNKDECLNAALRYCITQEL